MNTILLIESQFLPPISFFKTLLQYDEIMIEQNEHYQKGSYRNRCYLPGANGVLLMSVPLQQGKHQHTPMNEVKIYNDKFWYREFWKTFTFLYRSSPYFEYYEEDFRPFFAEPATHLLEFNLQLLQCICRLLKIKLNLQLSQEYLPTYTDSQITDMRNQLLPEKNKNEHQEHYVQVFEDRIGFQPDMSIVDLLFALGPDSLSYLKK